MSWAGGERAWGALAIGLGVWEAVAHLTGRCPTVSTAVSRASRRRRKLTRVAVVVWTAGLLRHLYTHDSNRA